MKNPKRKRTTAKAVAPSVAVSDDGKIDPKCAALVPEPLHRAERIDRENDLA
jgi:hypothetical protein